MLVLALEFSRIRAARLDRVSASTAAADRGDRSGASGGPTATSPGTAGPLPQNGRARSGRTTRRSRPNGGRRHELPAAWSGRDRCGASRIASVQLGSWPAIVAGISSLERR